jgi:hypothetical protein
MHLFHYFAIKAMANYVTFLGRESVCVLMRQMAGANANPTGDSFPIQMFRGLALPLFGQTRRDPIRNP